ENDIYTVHIARKRTTHLQNIPMYVIALTVKVPKLSFRSETANQDLANRVLEKTTLQGSLLVLINEKDNKKTVKAVMAIPHAKVYQRDS
ncbi:MAG: hypothetical protein MI892_12020, partial [Desulfobacterales bacterium]|nr:hypothetical protein [Desulfobacterales bacterium]